MLTGFPSASKRYLIGDSGHGHNTADLLFIFRAADNDHSVDDALKKLHTPQENTLSSGFQKNLVLPCTHS